MTGLKADQHYTYRVGDVGSGVFSNNFTLRTLADSTRPLSFAVYGDMGYVNQHALPFVAKEASAGTIDFVLHGELLCFSPNRAQQCSMTEHSNAQ